MAWKVARNSLTREAGWAVLTAVAERGLGELTVDVVAERLGRSRASVYRDLGDREALLVLAHRCAVQDLSNGFGRVRPGPPRMQLEEVFTELRTALSGREGRAFRQVRSAVVGRGDLEEFRRREVEELVALRRWVETLMDPLHAREEGVVEELTAQLWSLCLGRPPPRGELEPVKKAELDLVFHLLSPFIATEEQVLRAEFDGLGEVTLLGDLL
ncbi:MAG: hypothetical protein AMXMBFR34_54100 [Myxococcaceae bacterium]